MILSRSMSLEHKSRQPFRWPTCKEWGPSDFLYISLEIVFFFQARVHLVTTMKALTDFQRTINPNLGCALDVLTLYRVFVGTRPGASSGCTTRPPPRVCLKKFRAPQTYTPLVEGFRNETLAQILFLDHCISKIAKQATIV